VVSSEPVWDTTRSMLSALMVSISVVLLWSIQTDATGSRGLTVKLAMESVEQSFVSLSS
jgi:hypothetical protein